MNMTHTPRVRTLTRQLRNVCEMITKPQKTKNKLKIHQYLCVSRLDPTVNGLFFGVLFFSDWKLGVFCAVLHFTVRNAILNTGLWRAHSPHARTVDANEVNSILSRVNHPAGAFGVRFIPTLNVGTWNFFVWLPTRGCSCVFVEKPSERSDAFLPVRRDPFCASLCRLLSYVYVFLFAANHRRRTKHAAAKNRSDSCYVYFF